MGKLKAMTEWQEHVTACLDVIGQVTEILPQEVLVFVFPILQQHADNFFSIHQYMVCDPNQVNWGVHLYVICFRVDIFLCAAKHVVFCISRGPVKFLRRHA